MTTAQFFEKFDLFAGAPDAVAKMRSLILELAVRGQLTSASSHPSASSDPSATPFPIPQDWQWVALGDVFTLEYGDNLPATKRSETGEYPVYGSNGIVGTHHAFLTEKPAIIIGRKGSAGALNVATGPSWTTDVAYFVCPPKGTDLYFTYYLFSTLHLDKLGKGIKPGLNRKEAYGLQIALPPLAEQKRIVAKVDELMALCDQLDAQQQERDTKHTALAQASLARFAEAPTPTNLNLLFHSSFSIQPSDLRKTILTLAVQGKLVSQDPNDEPAEELLRQIATHKKQVLSEGKRRGQTSAEVIPLEGNGTLPVGWIRATLGALTINRDGERIPVSKDERQRRTKVYDYYGASGVIDKIDGYLFEKPLLLIGEDGANLLSRSTPIAFIARGQYWVNNHAHVLDGISEDFLRFLELHINAIDLAPFVTGTAQPKMNQAKMNTIPVNLPPLAEQKRIVAKVEELMTLVDALEAQQAAADQAATHLLDAVVSELAAAA